MQRTVQLLALPQRRVHLGSPSPRGTPPPLEPMRCRPAGGKRSPRRVTSPATSVPYGPAVLDPATGNVEPDPLPRPTSRTPPDRWTAPRSTPRRSAVGFSAGLVQHAPGSRQLQAARRAGARPACGPGDLARLPRAATGSGTAAKRRRVLRTTSAASPHPFLPVSVPQATTNATRPDRDVFARPRICSPSCVRNAWVQRIFSVAIKAGRRHRVVVRARCSASTRLRASLRSLLDSGQPRVVGQDCMAGAHVTVRGRVQQPDQTFVQTPVER